jgi:hypothetical protein
MAQADESCSKPRLPGTKATPLQMFCPAQMNAAQHTACSPGTHLMPSTCDAMPAAHTTKASCRSAAAAVLYNYTKDQLTDSFYWPLLCFQRYFCCPPPALLHCICCTVHF